LRCDQFVIKRDYVPEYRLVPAKKRMTPPTVYVIATAVQV
jgi:hypothetical protein